jgi:hypothetical protein
MIARGLKVEGKGRGTGDGGRRTEDGDRGQGTGDGGMKRRVVVICGNYSTNVLYLSRGGEEISETENPRRINFANIFTLEG